MARARGNGVLMTVIVAVLFFGALLLGGISMCRYSIIPQDNKGPHGGSLTYIDQRMPSYIEFVATPGSPEWVFQIYIYDSGMQQKSIAGSGRLRLVLPDGTQKELDLRNAKLSFTSKGPGCLEGRMKLSGVTQFSAFVSIYRGTRIDYLEFTYPQQKRRG